MVLVAVICVLVFMLSLLLLVAMLVLLERKILGLVQCRKGPNIVSYFGILQTVADGVKLLTKEMIYVGSDRFALFYFSPFFMFSLSLLLWFFIPGGGSSETGGCSVLVVLFVSSLGVYSVLWAGWGSSSIYALMGGVRAVAQMVSYEVVMGLFIMVLIYLGSSLSWESVSKYYCTGGNGMTIFLLMLLMWLGVILAELNRTPFDLVEGESELVGSYNVEYSGYSFTLFFLAEYMNIWVLVWISVLVFYGGSSLVLVLLGSALVIYIRGLMPRYKFTDLMALTWRVYLPTVLLGLSYIFYLDLF